MSRTLIVGLALAVFMPAWAVDDVKDKKDGEMDLKVEGKLTKDDPLHKRRKTPHKVHEYKMKAGNIYVIDMVSKDFDTYLRLENAKGDKLAANDDAGPKDLNSRIVFKAPQDDSYRIIATAFEGTGTYTLTVRRGTAEELARYDDNPFKDLVGKAAPEIVAEFSFNGATKKLSDLKGKVVLLDFWAVWCGPCIQTFPHLRDWDKEFKPQGLEILGVTTYYESLGFDKTTGKLKNLTRKVKDPKTGDETVERVKQKPAEEHDMLKDFAAYHKLTHRLMTVTKDNNQKAGKDYMIRGIPHAVLVDRGGIVRMVRVGSGPDNAEDLEDEIRRLISQK